MLLVLSMATMLEAPSFAQRLTVKGTVSDAAGPIIGATVLEKGTTNGTSTDVDGGFTLEVSPDSQVEISCIGYSSQEYSAKLVPSFIQLVEDTEFLEETVIVGYGVQKKSNVTGAIASVKSDALENRSNETVGSSLQGKLAGVQILNNSGAPGASSAFRIRGYSSTTSSPDPLIIVDGLKVKDIDYLDPESVESVEVLKDAASAAIYGAQAGNGVVLITTKSGNEGNARVFYNNLFSFKTPLQNLEMMSASEYKQYWKEAGYPDSVFQYGDTNWQDVVFETGLMQRHTIGLQGGNNRFSYYVDATYMNNNGLVTGDYDTNDRITGQVNVAYKIKPWLKIGTNTSIERGKIRSVSENALTGTGSVVGGAYYFDPTVPVVYEDDSLVPEATGLLEFEALGYYVPRDEQRRVYGQSLIQVSDLWNPLVMREIFAFPTYTNIWRTNINGTAYAEITPSFIKGLTFTSRLGYRLSSSYAKGYNHSYYINHFQLTTAGIMRTMASNQQYYQWENFANYLKTIGKHDISAMVGMEFGSTRYETLNALANGLTHEAENVQFQQYYDTSASTRTMGGTDYSRSNLSYFGRLAYTYDNRFNLQGNFRADAFGLSRLSKNNRWGFFPSVSAGWTISNEPFFKSIFGKDNVSFMKFRASWGINGNINSLGDFSWTNAMSLENRYNIMDNKLVTAANPSTVLANPNVTWEQSKQVDAGVDMRFLKDRLSLSVDYYNKITTNMLASVKAPAVSGASTTYINSGKIRNNGWEFDLSWKDSIGKDFSYSISANLSTVNNLVVESPLGVGRTGGGRNFFSTVTYLESGYPMWYIRTYKVKGFNEKGVATYYSADELGTDDGKDYTGSGIPDFTYGLTLALRYKSFDFSIFGSGVQGNEMFLCIYRSDLPEANLPKFVFDQRWTAATASTAKYPAPNTTAMINQGYATSDMWVFDASYFKIKQIQLGYTMPKKVLDALHLKGLRVYGSLDNAFTFTKYPGNDPESMSSTYGNSIALDKVNYPSTRNFNIGLNISF